MSNGQFAQGRAFRGPETVPAFGGYQLGHGKALAVTQMQIRIRERTAQNSGQCPPHRGFTRSARAHQKKRQCSLHHNILMPSSSTRTVYSQRTPPHCG